ncbi:hypothetical protein D0T11_17440 [Hymenobacter rubripertinctus]|uniref:Uncharacterized protein n=1 Tax=Hymenobacter rubripertinctus TaxID=2029981 RepID=A0A418QPF1_9BACT|nr:hypothetical protein D0T11_17440 [Hymenobacter rubripertinctus]
MAVGAALNPAAALAQRALNNYDLTTLGSVSTTNNGYNTYLPNGRPEDSGASFDATTPPEAYLSVNWQAGTLLAAHGGAARVPAMRYNLKYNLIEVRDSSGTGPIRPVPLERLEGFTLRATPTKPAQSFTAVNFLAKGDRARTFMQELHPAGSKLQLLAWYRYAVTAARTNPALGVEIQPAAVVQEVLLMMRPATAGAPATQVSLNRKAVLRLFGSQASQVEAHAQQHNLRFDDANHVVDLVTYYNSLP